MSDKSEKFKDERKQLLQKILNILEINENNKMLSQKKLDEETNKHTQIIALVDDIKKYFTYSRWTYFSNKKREFKRDYLSLVRAIFKEMNVKMTSSTLVTKTDDNKAKCETFYIFEF